jgi:hypothetical protein
MVGKAPLHPCSNIHVSPVLSYCNYLDICALYWQQGKVVAGDDSLGAIGSEGPGHFFLIFRSPSYRDQHESQRPVLCILCLSSLIKSDHS